MLRKLPSYEFEIKPDYNVLDIETRKNGSLMCMGTIIHGRYQVYKDWESFLKVLLGQKKGFKIYAHNGANFDWLSLIEFLKEKNLHDRVEVIVSGSQGIGVNVKLKNKKGTIRLRDSARLLPQKLAKLSETFGVKQPKLNIDVLPEELFKQNPVKFWQYLEHDCKALREVLVRFHELINKKICKIKELPMTAASLALKVYRTGFMDREIMTPLNDKQKLFERRSYTGGRTQAIQHGIFSHVYGYDVNSMYPAVMKDNFYPKSYAGYWTFQYEGMGIYEVRFRQTNKDVLPVLRNEANQKFQYEGEGVYCHVELELLKEIGGNFEVIKGYRFIKWDRIFNSYVTTLYEIRKKAKEYGHEALEQIVKLLMNSLYGKFGQKPEGEKLIFATFKNIRKMEKEGRKIQRYENGDCWGIKEVSKNEHEFVAVASYVTSYARCHLYRLLYTVGMDAVYCDTDSVYTINPLPYSHQGPELGKLKLEFEGEMVIGGKKLYGKRDGEGKVTVRVKGVRIGGRNGFNFGWKDMVKVVSGDNVECIFQAPTTVKEVMKEGKKACVFLDRKKTIKMTG